MYRNGRGRPMTGRLVRSCSPVQTAPRCVGRRGCNEVIACERACPHDHGDPKTSPKPSQRESVHDPRNHKIIIIVIIMFNMCHIERWCFSLSTGTPHRSWSISAVKRKLVETSACCPRTRVRAEKRESLIVISDGYDPHTNRPDRLTESLFRSRPALLKVSLTASRLQRSERNKPKNRHQVRAYYIHSRIPSSARDRDRK